MSFTIGSRTFQGPFSGLSDIADEPGVYVVVCPESGGSVLLVDVGQSANLRTTLKNHERKDCWARVCAAHAQAPEFGILYTRRISENYRRAVEQEIRNQYQPPCGNV